jgi:hypothetical protein
MGLAMGLAINKEMCQISNIVDFNELCKTAGRLDFSERRGIDPEYIQNLVKEGSSLVIEDKLFTLCTKILPELNIKLSSLCGDLSELMLWHHSAKCLRIIKRIYTRSGIYVTEELSGYKDLERKKTAEITRSVTGGVSTVDTGIEKVDL